MRYIIRATGKASGIVYHYTVGGLLQICPPGVPQPISCKGAAGALVAQLARENPGLGDFRIVQHASGARRCRKPSSFLTATQAACRALGIPGTDWEYGRHCARYRRTVRSYGESMDIRVRLVTWFEERQTPAAARRIDELETELAALRRQNHLAP